MRTRTLEKILRTKESLSPRRRMPIRTTNGVVEVAIGMTSLASPNLAVLQLLTSAA